MTLDIYPLCDCLQLPLDNNYDRILVCYYTDSPSKPYDAFTRKMYKIPDETPLYLCTEVWQWEESRYNRIDRSEKILPKEEAQALVKKYLRFIIPIHEWSLNYKDYYDKYKNYKPSLYHLDSTGYYNLGQGGRWNRAWEGGMYDDEYDALTMRFGPVY